MSAMPRCASCGDRHLAGECTRAPLLAPGTRLDDKYVIVRHLSSGGMGAVYEVEHTLLGKRLAAKLLLPELARRREVLERFRREARAASAIGHEHIIEVTDLGQASDGAPFLVMELLHGRTLGDEIARLGRIPPRRAVRIARQILTALVAAHERGIIHRDLKPDNIFLTPRQECEDFVKVLDFGISKFLVPEENGAGEGAGSELTALGAVVGTPTYMSPEQARGDARVDHRADLYAVGALLYRMLTGERPYTASNFNALVFAIAQGKLVRPRERVPEIPPFVEAVVVRAMAVDPDQRFPSARAFHDALSEEERTREWTPPPILQGNGNGAPVAAASHLLGDRTGAGWSQQSSTMADRGRPVATPRRLSAFTLALAGSLAVLTVAAGSWLAHRRAAHQRLEESLLADPPPLSAPLGAPTVTPLPAPALIHLSFALDPPEARLTIDGAEVARTGVDLARDGRRHVLRAEAADHAAAEVPFFASGDQTLQLRLKKKGAGKGRPRSIDQTEKNDPNVKALMKLMDGLKDDL